jgi:glycosidase
MKTTRTPDAASIRAKAALRASAVETTTQAGADKAAAIFARSQPRGLRRRSLPLDLAQLRTLLDDRALFGAHPPLADIEVESQREIANNGDTRHVLVSVKVRYDGAAAQGAGAEQFLVPIVVDGRGVISDGFASASFKAELLSAVERGATSFASDDGDGAPRDARPVLHSQLEVHRVDSSSVANVRGPSRGPSAAVRAARSASLPANGAADVHAQAAALATAIHGGEVKEPWTKLIENEWTSRDRYELVVENAQKLSPENADALVVEFFKDVVATRERQPKAIQQFHDALATRPKFSPVFYGYAQFIGVPEGKSEATFDDVKQALDVIGDGRAQAGSLASMLRDPRETAGLGFHDVELLPFYLSPQKDGGYDITDHAEVAPDVGGNAAFERFMAEVVKRGMRITADLVANHVSGEHVWAKALEAGDESALARFVAWDDAVKIGEREVDGKTFNVFLHTKGENAGKISHVWQIFPDNNPDTFIQTAGHKIFASFMNPYQWDVNVADPAVLAYYLKTLGKFANLGQMGTRMDAIIHSGKKPGTFNINNPESQAFMALAKAFASHVVPGNMFLPEANLPWDEAKRDWLSPERRLDGVVENTSGDVLISFDVHRAIWDSLLKSDKRAWVNAQDELGEIPENKSLLVYLGLHDETLIDDPELRKALLARGFHDFAGRGVGDSPAALLDGNADRLAMAHALLYSSKGHPAVYYRTLVGSPNNESYYEDKVADRLNDQRKAGEREDLAKARDSRDLDRGPVHLAEYERALADGYKPAVMVRALNALWDENATVRSNDVDFVENVDAGVVSIARKSMEAAPLLQLINLTGETKTVTMSTAELAGKLGWLAWSSSSLRDLLGEKMTGRPHSIEATVDGDRTSIELQPYEALYLSRDE